MTNTQHNLHAFLASKGYNANDIALADEIILLTSERTGRSVTEIARDRLEELMSRVFGGYRTTDELDGEVAS